MMIGEPIRCNPTVQLPTWDPSDDLTACMGSPVSVPTTPGNFKGNAGSGGSGDYSRFLDSLTALHRYLPSNEFSDSDPDSAVDAFSCDQFRMYEFKVRKCARGRSHDWTECPYAHPGEKARRRDPRRYHYSGTACPDFRKGGCKRGDSCEFAHGVFECWLHPSRYRTQPCKDGLSCRRRVCFFAHTPEQLRVLPNSAELYEGSPIRHPLDSYLTKSGSFLSSPPISPPAESPPMSPNGSYSSPSELVASMRNLHLGSPKVSPRLHVGSGFGSPRFSALRPGFFSLSSPPSQVESTRMGVGVFDLWESSCEEEPVLERVESGRNLRAKLYAKLSRENSLGRVESSVSPPDIGWVSELVK